MLRSLRPYRRRATMFARMSFAVNTAKARIKDKTLTGYRQEDSVNPESTTETYFAARVSVDNFRWAGVPFYIRTGKRLPVKTTEVVIEFKNDAEQRLVREDVMILRRTCS